MSIFTSRLRFMFQLLGTCGLLVGLAARLSAEDAKDLGIRAEKTPKGTPYGISGDKPEKPAPTLFIFASDIESMNQPASEIYSRTGRELLKDGWIFVVLNPPCHGEDQIPGEPTQINGWAHRLKTGQDLIGPFVAGCQDVLDHLIAEGYTDPEWVAASGTSRGGFCAFHFAAAEPRVRAVSGVAPVTNLLALREFSELQDHEPTKALYTLHLAEKLVGRSVLMTIGNDDARVSTDDCVNVARRLAKVTREKMPDLRVIPVELIVGPSNGHSAIDDAYEIQAAWFRKIKANNP